MSRHWAARPKCSSSGVAPDDLAAIAAAESVGFRHAVDVDVPGEELSLLVREPEGVTQVHADLDRVPGT
jgi:hypothetical protein